MIVRWLFPSNLKRDRQGSKVFMVNACMVMAVDQAQLPESLVAALAAGLFACLQPHARLCGASGRNITPLPPTLVVLIETRRRQHHHCYYTTVCVFPGCTPPLPGAVPCLLPAWACVVLLACMYCCSCSAPVDTLPLYLPACLSVCRI